MKNFSLYEWSNSKINIIYFQKVSQFKISLNSFFYPLNGKLLEIS